jgi:F-type H+-transporting ATPase subunit b
MDFNLTLIGQTVSMIVFVWFSMKFIWPVLMKVIEDRRKIIADGIAAGEKGQKELAEARHGSEAIMAEARQKAVQVVDLAHKRSGDLVAEAKNTALAEGQRLVAQAKAQSRSARHGTSPYLPRQARPS